VSAVDWASVRAEFPALGNWTYLNTATFGQLPRRAVEASMRHFAHRDQTACADFIDWYDDADALRTEIAQLIGATAEDIAFVPNASHALAMLVNGMRWRDGDRVVTLEHEFPNNLYTPALLRGSGVEFVACPWERFHETVDERTRLVLVSSVNYNTGFAPPLEEIAIAVHRRGGLLYVDGTQSVGALRFDTARVQPDMLAVHGYKWLLSPPGAGFVYVRRDLRDRLDPMVAGWRSHHDWRNVDNLHHGVPEYSDAAEKYEGGGLPFPLLYAMRASVQMMLEIGPGAIENRVLDLARLTREMLRELGAQVEDYASPIVAARFEGLDVSSLARHLKDRRIIVAARKGALRVSPHFYNDESDSETLCEELKSLLATTPRAHTAASTDAPS
jgi:cysteine desulfurase/selenocysteine lyase